MSNNQFPIQVQLPEAVLKSLDTLKTTKPNEVVKVEAKLDAPSADVGQGTPIRVTGKVTAFGIGVPMLVLVRVSKRPDPQLIPVAVTFSAPITGDFSAKMDTEKLDFGDYALQVVAMPLVAPPAISALMTKEIAEPRVGASVAMGLQGVHSPLDLVSGDTGYADYTLLNTGNVGLRNIVRKAFFQAGVGGSVYPASYNPIGDAATLAAGASRAYTNHAVASVGMGTASYDAVVVIDCSTDNPKLTSIYYSIAYDRKVNEVRIVSASAGLIGVLWSDIL